MTGFRLGIKDEDYEDVLPNPRNRHKSQPSLSDDSHDAGDPDSTATPLLDDITFPDVEDDEGKCMNKCEDKHRPCHPAMPDVEFLVGDSSECGDGVGFGAEDTNIWLDLATANGSGR